MPLIPNTWETEAGRSLWPGLQSKFQDSQDCYTEKLCPEDKQQTNAPVLIGLYNKVPEPDIGANAERSERERSQPQPILTLLTSQSKKD